MRKGNLFVISGPSGAGKGTLVSRLLERVPGAWVSISATTRAPREGEVDGVHYLFVDDAEFDRMVEEGGLLEWAQVHDHKYGTPRALVESHMAVGDQVILEIDVQGGFQIKEKNPDAHLVFIEPPSLDELERRLRGRGTEDEDSVVLRMRNAELELSRKMEYDIQFVNDDIDVCTDEVVSYIERQATI
ncbi:guanylate kinase [Slackia faecicanis]|uniref:Guanylate kinase n=1 Tax=Slackia faecicanis TaxID=255723 RepID=A0A3N0AH24_9ACTN|nr:guanylate kinase [Slackia faecicanis]MDO5358570.1 guanylate kinase [Slackia faecicanis]RNL21355.1 guanylate kinase [Slackia faecicanis]